MNKPTFDYLYNADTKKYAVRLLAAHDIVRDAWADLHFMDLDYFLVPYYRCSHCLAFGPPVH